MARAIENTVYVAAVGQPGPRYTGHSLVVGPAGDVVAEAGDGDHLLTASVGTEGLDAGPRRQPVAAQPQVLVVPDRGAARRRGRGPAPRCSVAPWPGTQDRRLVAEMVANVMTVSVAAGDHVDVGDTVVLLESMKMEIPVLAEHAGTVAGRHGSGSATSSRRATSGLPRPVVASRLLHRGGLRVAPGGVPEWPIGTALKAVAGRDVSRGFESRPLCWIQRTRHRPLGENRGGSAREDGTPGPVEGQDELAAA